MDGGLFACKPFLVVHEATWDTRGGSQVESLQRIYCAEEIFDAGVDMQGTCRNLARFISGEQSISPNITTRRSA